MAIFVLVIGAIIFLVGIGGHFVVGSHFTNKAHPADRKGARLVLTLAAIIIGAWLVIASAATLLHSHAHSHAQQSSSNPS